MIFQKTTKVCLLPLQGKNDLFEDTLFNHISIYDTFSFEINNFILLIKTFKKFMFAFMRFMLFDVCSPSLILIITLNYCVKTSMHHCMLYKLITTFQNNENIKFKFKIMESIKFETEQLIKHQTMF